MYQILGILSQVCAVLSFQVAYQKVLLVAGGVTIKLLRPLPTASVMKAELERRSSEAAVPRVHRTLRRYAMAKLPWNQRMETVMIVYLHANARPGWKLC